MKNLNKINPVSDNICIKFKDPVFLKALQCGTYNLKWKDETTNLAYGLKMTNDVQFFHSLMENRMEWHRSGAQEGL